MPIKKYPFAAHERAAVGLVGLGTATGVSGALISRAGQQHAAVRPLGGSLGTIGEFAGIATTASLGKSTIKKLRVRSY